MWKELLDENKTAPEPVVLCSEVQEMIYDPKTGRRFPQDPQYDDESPTQTEGQTGQTGSSPPNGSDLGTSPTIDPQQLGMINARNREVVRSTARLLFHFGFDHFARKEKGSKGSDEDIDKGNKKSPVEAGRMDGRAVYDVTHAKGEWGLRWKRR